MVESIEIREESPRDFDAVCELTNAAFSASEFGHNGEAELIDSLRTSSSSLLSLVASLDKQVIGHILFTPVSIESESGSLKGMGLAPMSVHPKFQRQGVGTSLIREGIRQLWSAECQFIAVLGHPDYYPRFGFRPASDWKVSHGFDGIPQEVFFLLCGAKESLQSFAGGKAFYSNQFGPQHQV